MRRRSLTLLALVLPTSLWAQSLPARNLLVEMRWLDSAQASSLAATASLGDWVVGTGGSVSAGPSVVISSSSSSTESVQSMKVLVLNGAMGQIQLTRAVPLRAWDFVWTTQGVAVISDTVWAQDVTQLRVTPRWQGAKADLTLELTAIAVAAGQAADQQVVVQSTLKMTMGQWLTVARIGPSASRASAGERRSADAQALAAKTLQLRVSLP